MTFACIIWIDQAEFHIVCNSCFYTNQEYQWSGSTRVGNWSKQRTGAHRLAAKANLCEICGTFLQGFTDQTIVINLKKIPVGLKKLIEKVDRTTLYGNPHKMARESERISVVYKYFYYFYEKLQTDTLFLENVLKLKSKALACHCHPKACHGHVIAHFLNATHDFSPEDIKEFIDRTLENRIDSQEYVVKKICGGFQ